MAVLAHVLGRGGSGTPSVAFPTAPTAGRTVVVVLWSAEGTDPDANLPGLAGFTRIGTAANVSGGGLVCGVWAKTAGPSEPTTYSFDRALGGAWSLFGAVVDTTAAATTTATFATTSGGSNATTVALSIPTTGPGTALVGIASTGGAFDGIAWAAPFVALAEDNRVAGASHTHPAGGTLTAQGSWPTTRHLIATGIEVAQAPTVVEADHAGAATPTGAVRLALAHATGGTVAPTGSATLPAEPDPDPPRSSPTASWPRRTDHRVLVTNPHDGTVRAELACTQVSWGHVLNAPGAFTASLPLDAPGIDGAGLAPAQAGVVVLRDGQPLWSGLVWGAESSVDSNSLTVRAEGWLSYLRRRIIRTDLVFAQADQFHIARALVDHATAASGSALIDTTPGPATSGVLRDRTYLGAEHKSVGEALEQLGAVRNGFDHAFRPHFTNDGRAAVGLHLTYPPTGRDTGHVLEPGVNVRLLDATDDGDSIATHAYLVGAGDAEDRLTATRANVAALARFPRLDAVRSHNDITRQDTLEDHAARLLTRGAHPVRRLRLQLFPDAHPVLGSYTVGDRVTVRGGHGWLQVDGVYRLADLTVTVAGGTEEAVANLVPAALFDEEDD